MHLKEKAYNLNLLKQSQRCWILIKNSINTLVPKPVIKLPSNSSEQRKFLFNLTSSSLYISVMDYLAYFNAVLYVITVEGHSDFYADMIRTCVFIKDIAKMRLCSYLSLMLSSNWQPSEGNTLIFSILQSNSYVVLI